MSIMQEITNMKIRKVCALLMVLCFFQGSAMGAEKKMSTYQRQVNLMKRINEAQKSKQLTVKQAKGLRKDLSKIAVKKQKERDSNVGTTQVDDMSEVEERLTKISKKIDELKEENVKDAAAD
jgi:hypothetical protein